MFLVSSIFKGLGQGWKSLELSFMSKKIDVIDNYEGLIVIQNHKAPLVIEMLDVIFWSINLLIFTMICYFYREIFKRKIYLLVLNNVVVEF